MSRADNTVPGYGPKPCLCMFIGEAPGYHEWEDQRPFVGRSGQELQQYLRQHGLHLSQFYLSNVSQDYTSNNPDPTPEQIAFWVPTLVSEIRNCRPKLIVAIGRHAIQWFLGADADLETCHGLPHKPGAFDSTDAGVCVARIVSAGLDPDTLIIIPCYHPAGAFYRSTTRTGQDIRALLSYDYAQVAATLKSIRAGVPVEFRHDPYAGHEQYLDVTGEQLADEISDIADNLDYFALDTEGTPESQWSMQSSFEDGTARVLRTVQPDFSTGARQIQYLLDRGVLVVVHDASTPRGCCYDTQTCRPMGVELNKPVIRIFNTMYAAYLTRIEPQGLKPLSWRRLGIHMTPYQEMVEGLGREKQITYLRTALDTVHYTWSKTAPYNRRLPDGQIKRYKPKSITQRMQSILADVEKDKRNKDDEPVDIIERWKKVPKTMKAEVVQVLGCMPTATLDDLPLNRAVYYAGQDADATRRLYPILSSMLRMLDIK